VVDGHRLGSVCAFEPHVPHGWHVQVNVLPLDLDALELAVVELSRVLHVLHVSWSWLPAGDDASEVFFSESSPLRGLEPILNRKFRPFHELAVDRLGCGPRVALPENIFRFDAWDEAAVAGDVLGLGVGGGTPYPVMAVLGNVAVLEDVLVVVL